MIKGRAGSLSLVSLGVGVMVLTVGCGPNGGGAPTSALSATPSVSSPPAAATASPILSSTPLPTAILALQPGQEMGVVCSNDAVALYALTPATGTLRQLMSLNLDTLFAGWSTPSAYQYGTSSSGVSVNCDRDGFSADFTKLLFYGTPPGLAQTHIGYIDLTDHSVHDLTAPRQGTGFGAQLLDEGDPAFLGPGNGTLSFGSDQVVFSDLEGTSVTSVSNPSQASQVNSSDIYTEFRSSRAVYHLPRCRSRVLLTTPPSLSTRNRGLTVPADRLTSRASRLRIPPLPSAALRAYRASVGWTTPTWL